MPALQRLYLHIGVEKTGTTTLQAAMALNRELLRRHGFCYPQEPGAYGHIGLALGAAQDAAVADLRKAFGLVDRDRRAAFRDAYSEQIVRQLAESGCHTAIFSSEHCSSRLSTVDEIARVHRLLAPLARECHVIVYLRRQDELAVSEYSTLVKSGHTRIFSFPDHRPWYDFLALLNKWSEVFGKDRVIVRLFEREAMVDGELYADFFSVVGFEQHGELRRPPDLNRSLDIHTLEFLRRFNAHIPFLAEHGANPDRGALGAILDRISTGERMRPDPTQAAAFLDRFAQSNAAVARKYLNRADGVLFAAKPSQDGARAPSLDTDTAVAIAAALWRWQQARARHLQAGSRKPPVAG